MRPGTFTSLLSTALVIFGASLVALTWLAGDTPRRFALEAFEEELAAEARLVGAAIAETGSSAPPETSRDVHSAGGEPPVVRFTFFVPSGRPIGGDVSTQEPVDDDGAGPEVRAARERGRGSATRFSPAFGESALYVAVEIERGGTTLGVVRAVAPLSRIENAVSRFRLRVGLWALALFSLCAVVSVVVTRRFSRTLRRIREHALALARGDTGTRLPVPDAAEIGGLAEALNRLAVTLDERDRVAARLQRERDTLLSSALEALLIVDAEGRIVDHNDPAASMLGLSARASSPIPVAHAGLKAFVKRTLAGSDRTETELRLGPDENRYVEARGIPLRDRFGRTTGAVVALDDRTELRNLASVRRDFAAQVSHELKTPLTAIKGFADTLLGGALAEPGHAEPFVRVIAEQTERLHDLVEGLMELARLEREAETEAIEKSWHPISELLDHAVSELEVPGAFELHLDCPPELTARVGPVLLERAIRNLVDNALRYASEGRAAWVSAREEGNEIVITVRDRGEGVDEADRERIFERFYRASRTRGRHPEGSGLGLAIVKHVVRAHGGRVSVESPPEGGTSFTVRIPRY